VRTIALPAHTTATYSLFTIPYSLSKANGGGKAFSLTTATNIYLKQ
jgi:hypothetical protein